MVAEALFQKRCSNERVLNWFFMHHFFPKCIGSNAVSRGRRRWLYNDFINLGNELAVFMKMYNRLKFIQVLRIQIKKLALNLLNHLNLLF
jgi:hypothetical protein